MREKDVSSQRNYSGVEKISIGLDSEGKGTYKFNFDWGTVLYAEEDAEKVHLDVNQAYDVPDEEREALMEFYRATGGDNWTRNDGWGSDLPVSKWYGIGSLTQYYGAVGEPGKQHVSSIEMANNNLTGTLPECLLKLPYLENLALQDNNLSGEFPENPLAELMERSYNSGACLLHLSRNRFGPTVPEWAQKHEMFQHFWPEFITQNGMDASILETVRIPAPDINFIDLDGNRYTSPKEYSDNRLTILFNWATWCPFTPQLMVKLIPAYEKYHDVGLNIIGIVDIQNDVHNGGDTQEAVDKYIKDNNIQWPNVSLYTDDKGEFC